MSDLAQTSIYLNAADRELIAKLMERENQPSRSALIRFALQRLEVDGSTDRAARLREIAEEIKRLVG